jgi:translation initiation factor 3 subunit L
VVEISKKSLYARVPSCQITVYYYLGFCYLMMRRYQVRARVCVCVCVCVYDVCVGACVIC